MRVYVPGQVSALSHYASGQWEPERGFAVTPLLLEISAHEDQEELAEQARDAAAAASVIEYHSPQRLVISIDYPRADVEPVPDEHPAAVKLSGRIIDEAISCLFIDEPESADDARAAAEGDANALERLEERQLLWYHVSEMAHVPVVS